MTTESTLAQGQPDRQALKSLAFGMVSDLSRLLADTGFGDRPIDIVEALVFSMFIIADTYVLAKPEKDEAVALVHAFYHDMEHHFIDKIVREDYQLADADEVQAVAARFHDLSRGRFAAYGDKFKQDISEPVGLSCPATVSYLLDNLFIQPLEQEEKLQLMGGLSDKVLSYWAGCVQHFK